MQDIEIDYTTKWYMHNPKSFQEYEMHKILWHYEVQMDHLILVRRPEEVIINKKRQLAV